MPSLGGLRPCRYWRLNGTAKAGPWSKLSHRSQTNSNSQTTATAALLCSPGANRQFCKKAIESSPNPGAVQPGFRSPVNAGRSSLASLHPLLLLEEPLAEPEVRLRAALIPLQFLAISLGRIGLRVREHGGKAERRGPLRHLTNIASCLMCGCHLAFGRNDAGGKASSHGTPLIHWCTDASGRSR
jgi:hypothetical protein